MEDRSTKWRKLHPIRYRASYLYSAYKREDIKYGRIGVELPSNYITPQWIIDNIFTKPCAHCGKEGWDVIGCNRLDNSKPHTKDNVEPCCKEHNDKLASEYHKELFSKRVDQIDKVTGEVIHQWESAKDAAIELGYSQGHISHCCEGGYFDKCRNKWHKSETYKGYYWKTPL
jgi:hypothetical protein